LTALVADRKAKAFAKSKVRALHPRPRYRSACHIDRNKQPDQ
jgi:hypothetical protein